MTSTRSKPSALRASTLKRQLDVLKQENEAEDTALGGPKESGVVTGGLSNLLPWKEWENKNMVSIQGEGDNQHFIYSPEAAYYDTIPFNTVKQWESNTYLSIFKLSGSKLKFAYQNTIVPFIMLTYQMYYTSYVTPNTEQNMKILSTVLYKILYNIQLPDSPDIDCYLSHICHTTLFSQVYGNIENTYFQYLVFFNSVRDKISDMKMSSYAKKIAESHDAYTKVDSRLATAFERIEKTQTNLQDASQNICVVIGIAIVCKFYNIYRIKEYKLVDNFQKDGKVSYDYMNPRFLTDMNITWSTDRSRLILPTICSKFFSSILFIPDTLITNKKKDAPILAREFVQAIMLSLEADIKSIRIDPSSMQSKTNTNYNQVIKILEQTVEQFITRYRDGYIKLNEMDCSKDIFDLFVPIS